MINIFIKDNTKIIFMDVVNCQIFFLKNLYHFQAKGNPLYLGSYIFIIN